MSAIGEKHADLLLPYVSYLERCVLWAETNIQQELIIDPTTNETRYVKGWRSNHLGAGSALGWCTAQVFSGISSIRKVLKSLMKANILHEFGGRKALSSNPKPWLNLMDSDLELGGERTTLKTVLYSRIIHPLVRKEASIVKAFQRRNVEESIQVEESYESDAPFSPLYSGILFGKRCLSSISSTS